MGAVWYKDIPGRAIIHMDLDAFFVSVEVKRDNRLKGRPLIIGGRSARGVVSSCSYEARKYGVHSAMPMKMALQRCPDALVLGGDMEAYTRESKLITDIIADQAPLFEKSSIDEFYIDVTGMDRFFGSHQWGLELRKKIIKESGLPISMGLSINKLVSKMATNEAKPNGERYIARGEEQVFIAPLPVRKIPMVGEKTARFLYDMGIRTVKMLREMPLEMLQATFGVNGSALWKKAHGIDDSPVVPYSERKSISTETTFETDSIDIIKMKAMLIAMVEKLTFKLRQEKKLTSVIAVKIRYADFETTSRQQRIPYTASDNILIHHVLELFDKLYNRRLMIRLVGVRMSGLVHGQYQIDMFGDTEEQINLFQAMDRLREKHGADILFRASGLEVDKRVRKNNNVFSAV